METLLIAMAVVAIAELGDKTQLVAIVLAGRLRRPLLIAAGMAVALGFMHGLAAFAGRWLDQLLPDRLLGWIIGTGFCLMALWMLRSSGHSRANVPRPSSQRHVFLIALFTFAMLEFGDKSQLTTLGLAAVLDPAWQVGLGAALGSIMINLPMIWLGYRLQNQLPQRLIQRCAAALFALIGAAVLITQAL
ncbi:MAG: TMEM165/GDT1 family protein [Wenzhouxiangella sp.]|nr:TMEM165/GDT1 family protein [Wenzhouxiangella sp.]MCH8478234.1 TMEM165/GDT1 family protein [Wenzhouxiangella sp.]